MQFIYAIIKIQSYYILTSNTQYSLFKVCALILGKGKTKTDACKTEHSMDDGSYKALLDYFLHTLPEIVSQENSVFKELFFDI